MKRAAAGFTLVELMIGLLIASFSVLVAAHVATMIVQQSAKGRQATDFNARARLIGRQLRTDTRLTGIGSTGAIAADATAAPWGTIIGGQTAGGVTPGGGYSAFPAMIGLNNVGGAVGGVPLLAGSDVVQMVVVNPSALVVTTLSAPATTNSLTIDPLADLTPFANCSLIYIVDHSTPSGSGRTQIAKVTAPMGSPVVLQDQLQFTVQAQSDIMCARISTYWVADTDGDGVGNYLMRSDIDPANPNPITSIGGGVFIQYDPVRDVAAPGVIDFQVAYSFSAEIYRAASLAPDPTRTWLNSATDPAIAGVNDSFDWFEVREARFSIQAKRMRIIDNFASTNVSNVQRPEDGGVFAGLPTALVPEILTTSETLVNLRYYDYGNPGGVAAEPY